MIRGGVYRSTKIAPAAFGRDPTVMHVTLSSVRRSTDWTYQRKLQSPYPAVDEVIVLSISIIYLEMNALVVFLQSQYILKALRNTHLIQFCSSTVCILYTNPL